MAEEVKTDRTETRARARGEGQSRREGGRAQQSASSQPHSNQPHSNQRESRGQQQATSVSTGGSQPQGSHNNQANNQRRRRRRRTPPQPPALRPGQVTNSTAVPVPAAPSKRGHKQPLATPRIGVGCIILRGDEILLVRERGRWSLPKGGLESGELVQDGARRETFEETGLVVELRDLAFIVEFQAESWGHHLQFFYTAREVSGDLQPRDPIGGASRPGGRGFRCTHS